MRIPIFTLVLALAGCGSGHPVANPTQLAACQSIHGRWINLTDMQDSELDANWSAAQYQDASVVYLDAAVDSVPYQAVVDKNAPNVQPQCVTVSTQPDIPVSQLAVMDPSRASAWLAHGDPSGTISCPMCNGGTIPLVHSYSWTAPPQQVVSAYSLEHVAYTYEFETLILATDHFNVAGR